MFRSKAFSFLHNIIDRNLYNVESNYNKSFQYILYSTNIENSDNTSNITLTKNIDEISQQPKTSNQKSEKIDTSVKTLSEITIEASPGSSNTTSNPIESDESDKLYKKLEIEIRGNDPEVLKSYGEFAVMAANYLDIFVGKHIALRKPIHERLTVLKSVHIHKKHRVQYETRTYYRYLDLLKLTGSTADTYLEYIERNLPEGVAMKITKVELQTLPEKIQQATPS
ncbi:28S ribosomal protein S10, mitochondrial [Apis florea]|uniref:28S ribosomal protein S10, mitochondrial n=1 Tax=Apis florea TaxID=7463 RepID=UPI000252BB8C|nr:28S ribosomal protein S10, mitochondrial [Apis florea]